VFVSKGTNTQIGQAMLVNQYVLMKKLLEPYEMPSLKDVAFTAYSEFEKDGIRLYIFSIIGTVNKRDVEICVGDGIECMGANLIILNGWEGLLFDGNKNDEDSGLNFTQQYETKFYHPPIFKDTLDDKEELPWLKILHELIKSKSKIAGITSR
jgi:hypothetical protein